MSRLSLSLLILLFASFIINLHYTSLLEQQNIQLSESKHKVIQLLDDKIAEYHFMVDRNYGDLEWKRSFFDSLEQSFEIMRGILQKDSLAAEDQIYLKLFIENSLKSATHFDINEHLERYGLVNIEGIFTASAIEVIKRLLLIINPFHFTHDIYFNDWDVWKISDSKDEVVYRMRLLKNHELRSISLKILPNEQVKVLSGNLAEIRILKQLEAKERSTAIKIQLYDWAKNDTIIEEFWPSVLN